MWGFISSGSGSDEVTSTPPPPEGPPAPPPKRVSFGQHGTDVSVRSVACGLAHSAAIIRDGELWTWGRNDQGQCGVSLDGCTYGEDGEVVEAVHVESVHEALAGGAVTLVACGAGFTAAYSADTHTLAVCGAEVNQFVQWGQTATATAWRQVPLMFEGGSDEICKEEEVLVQLVAGYGHLVMLTGQRTQSCH